MSSSYIEFKKNGIWVPDGFNELIASYLIVLLAKREIPIWISPMRDRLNEIRQERFTGWVNFGFNDYLDTDEKIDYIKKLFNELIRFVQRKGKYISKNELNSEYLKIGNKGSWVNDVETDEFIKYIRGIRDILGSASH